MHEQPPTGRVVDEGAYSRDLRSVVLQNLLHGVLFLFAKEPGLAGIARDFEHAGRYAGYVGGVAYTCSARRGPRPTNGPNCTFTVNHQAPEGILCEG